MSVIAKVGFWVAVAILYKVNTCWERFFGFENGEYMYWSGRLCSTMARTNCGVTIGLLWAHTGLTWTVSMHTCYTDVSKTKQIFEVWWYYKCKLIYQCHNNNGIFKLCELVMAFWSDTFRSYVNWSRLLSIMFHGEGMWYVMLQQSVGTTFYATWFNSGFLSHTKKI